MWFAAAITRLTASGALAGAIARVPIRRALPTAPVSSSASPVSASVASVDSGISASSPERALTPPGRAFFAVAVGAATRKVATTASAAASRSAAVGLRRAADSATPGANGIHYLLRVPAGLAVGLALKEHCAPTDDGGFAPGTWFPRSRPFLGRD